MVDEQARNLPAPPDRAGLVRGVMDRALCVQTPVVTAHVEQLRRRQPDASQAELVAALEKEYLALVATLGAAGGGAAAVPVVGTATSVALSIADLGTFLEATTMFTLATAEVHGLAVDDLQRRRALVLAVLLGHQGAALVEKTAGRAGAHWGRVLVQSLPAESIQAINRVLGRQFVTRFGTKSGVLVLGRAVPFGIGAAIGAAGNAALGYASVRAARHAFDTTPPLVSGAEPPRRPWSRRR